MKKFLIILVLIVLIPVAAAGIFIATFNANRYKPELEKRLGDVLGSPVRLGSISIGWEGGLALQLDKLAVYRDEASLDKPAAYLERGAVNVRLAPLLKKRLEIASVRLVRPLLNIVKEPDGVIKIDGIRAKSAPPAGASSAKAPSLQAAAFAVGAVKIENAEIGYLDKASSPPRRLVIRDMDVLVKNISLSEPIDFQAKMALFSGVQNFQMKGRVSLSPPALYVLEDFEADSNLGDMDFSELTAWVPQLKSAGLEQKPEGRLEVKVRRLKMDSGKLAELEGGVEIKDGRLKLRSLKGPLENVGLAALFADRDAELKNLSASLARGNIFLSGQAKNYLTSSPNVNFQVKLSDVVVDELLPASAPGKPRPDGRFSASFSGDARGAFGPAMTQTLNGAGGVSLKDGVIRNFNVLKTIFDALARIPGVVETLNTKLPPVYQQAVTLRDTPLEPIEFPVRAVNGTWVFQNARIASTGFEIYGAGQVTSSGAFNCQATLVMSQDLSAMFINGIPQMKYIADDYGRLVLPVRLSGDAQNIRIDPDMDYVFSRVMATKGQELISNTLQKALGKDPGAAQGTASSGGSSYEKVLSSFFQ